MSMGPSHLPLFEMKPEFSEVVFPASNFHTSASTDSSIRLIERERKRSGMDKCFITSAIIFAFVVAIVATGFIVRYEDKMSSYENRISSLEKELSSIYELWEEEYGPLHVSEKDFEYEVPTHQNLFGSDESSDDYSSKEEPKTESDSTEEKEHHGEHEVKMDMTRSRKKRQIPIQELPTYGPEVERTADGVPILEKSYLDRDRSEPRRPAAAFFARYEQPTTTDSTGLRLYEGLQATGGRNEPRSLDHSPAGQNGILPHHRTSAAWSERDERRQTRSRSSSIQLKSGDSSANLPSGFGESTGPNFSEEVTYRRNSAGRRQNNVGGRRINRICADGTTAIGGRCPPTSGSSHNTQTSSSNYQSSSSGTARNYRSSSLATNPSSAVTYHRRSRVPDSDILLPTSSDSQLRSLNYPPLQRFGRGDGEVVARVLQSDNEEALLNGHTQSASESQGTRRVTPRRQSAQSAYKQGRKIHHNANRNREADGNINIVRAEAWVETPGKPVAAHYVADVSNYTTSHRHYEGNGRLRNADGIFAAWKPSEWMEANASGDEKNFVLNQNGVLTIKRTGLYYIYAQIHYLDEHDINGYVVQVNTTPFLQCTTMTETQNGGSKSNSCFTAGITHLKENDRILVKDIETNRYSIFKPEKSFFGLMKIGDTNSN